MKYSVKIWNTGPKFVYWFLVLAWLLCVVSFWKWWLQGEHFLTPFGIFIASLALVYETLIPGWFFFFANRMRQPNPDLDIPRLLKIACIVTKTPSESFQRIIKPTLEGILNQSFPYDYDIFLCDEDPLVDTDLFWCKRNNIRICSRKGIDAYNRPEFPRRAKTKEGNLAFFYETIGYREYDVVVQFDGDHVPTSWHLYHMILPFANPQVGLVAAPSICDKNSSRSWLVRARAYAEAVFHGPLQAGFSDGWSPTAIGSHYAVRTKALKRLRHYKPVGGNFFHRQRQKIVGGLGPELAEDYSTTLAMNAGYNEEGVHWKIFFAPDAIAHGDGPETFDDSMRQEFQWARSMTVVLFKWFPGYWKHLLPKLRAQFLFTQLWYTLFSFSMLLAHVLPPIALVSGVPWIKINYPTFLLYFIALTVTSLLPAFWVKRQKMLRPNNAPVISWETLLFQIVRWPWALIGVVQGFMSVFFGKGELNYRVTPKGNDGNSPLPIRVVLPYLFISITQLCVAGLVKNPGSASGYYYFTISLGLLYLLTTWVIIRLHLKENALSIRPWLLQLGLVWKPVLLASLCVLLSVTVVFERGQEALLAILK